MIEGKYAEVGGMLLCLNCFKCSECGCEIQGSYSVSGKNVICVDCVNKKQKKCAKCGEALSGAYCEVGGKPYHKECLTCHLCGGPIEGKYS